MQRMKRDYPPSGGGDSSIATTLITSSKGTCTVDMEPRSVPVVTINFDWNAIEDAGTQVPSTSRYRTSASALTSKAAAALVRSFGITSKKRLESIGAVDPMPVTTSSMPSTSTSPSSSTHQRKKSSRKRTASSSSSSASSSSSSTSTNNLLTTVTGTGDTLIRPRDVGVGGGGLDVVDKSGGDVLKNEREALVLWRHPVRVVDYFCRELAVTLYDFSRRLWSRKWLVLVAVLTFTLLASVSFGLDGPHRKWIALLRQKFIWCAYWVGLGVLSSVGLGTGLHTFLLYLGPHIASVTLAAYECGSLRFPEPPYPDEILCPDGGATTSGDDTVAVAAVSAITLWSIMSKVRLEAFMWGAGTALGELPPYFMARAARFSGFDHDEDESMDEFEALLQEQRDNPDKLSFVNRAKLSIEKLVERVGFFGILACASIPNPLFDLAGITCGHFLVPFWTFFGATLVGKAVIKMHIQKLFVIIAFNESLVEKAVNLTERVPHVGKYLHAPFRDFLEKQKAKLHRGSSPSQDGTGGGGGGGGGGTSWLSSIFEKVIIVMVVYFVVSIVNSMAQRHHKRVCKANVTVRAVAGRKTTTNRRHASTKPTSGFGGAAFKPMATRGKKLADD